MAAGIDVIGPFSPEEFSPENLDPEDRGTGSLSKAMTDALPTGTVVSCEPVVVRGNVFVIVYTSS